MARAVSDDTAAWERTIADANEMAEQLRARGWTVTVVRAAHVAPVPPEGGDGAGDGVDGGDQEPFGLVYTAPDDVEADLSSQLARGAHDQYEVFRRIVGTDCYLLTRLADPDARLAVLLVGAVDRRRAEPLVAAARDRGELYSHVRLLDGTQLASFRHEDPEHFFPER